jgi:catechol 2,3-dioxygenase-like lactoylglutathione lyase family enzyme
MNKSCNFYCQIPGFKLVYGGSSNDSFTTFQIGKSDTTGYLNLELVSNPAISNSNNDIDRKHYGRIIFYVDDVDKLYSYFKSNKEISNTIVFEIEPRDASWGERYFHIRDPDGYQLSFAEPIKKRITVKD